jgi:hypothetical protein
MSAIEHLGEPVVVDARRDREVRWSALAKSISTPKRVTLPLHACTSKRVRRREQLSDANSFTAARQSYRFVVIRAVGAVSHYDVSNIGPRACAAIARIAS